MIRRTAQGILVAALLAGPAHAGDSERPPLEYDFVAVVDADSLDDDLRFRAALDDVHGPVLLARADLSNNFEGLYIRHVVNDPADGPLAHFRALGLVDSRFWADGMPAIVTDELDVAMLADLASPGLPAGDLRAVIATQYVADDVAAKMPLSFIEEPILAVSTERAANDEVSPVVSVRNRYFLIDPAAFSPDLAHEVSPAPSPGAFVGLLCDRAVKDTCVISDQVTDRDAVWVHWVQPETDDVVDGQEDEVDGQEDEVVGQENRERK